MQSVMLLSTPDSVSGPWRAYGVRWRQRVDTMYAVILAQMPLNVYSRLAFGDTFGCSCDCLQKETPIICDKTQTAVNTLNKKVISYWCFYSKSRSWSSGIYGKIPSSSSGVHSSDRYESVRECGPTATRDNRWQRTGQKGSH